MTVEALKAAIVELPDGDRHTLAAWLNDLDYDQWDREMAQDFSPGGRGSALVAQVRAELAAGKSAPLRVSSHDSDGKQPCQKI